jgi:hypothetical protein
VRTFRGATEGTLRASAGTICLLSIDYGVPTGVTVPEVAIVWAMTVGIVKFCTKIICVRKFMQAAPGALFAQIGPPPGLVSEDKVIFKKRNHPSLGEGAGIAAPLSTTSTVGP